MVDVPLELIEREIEELAAHINAGSARWLELVAEYDRREGWGGTGCRSTSEWVAWRCGLTSRSAREHVRVARALPDLPLIRGAFSRGELSYSKVRALTRVAETEAEADLLELARHATAAQLERIVRAARRCTAAEADEVQRESFVRWYWDDDDGSMRIDAKLPPEDGAQFLRALEAARDQLSEQRADEDSESDGDPAERLGPGTPDGSAEPQPPTAAPTPTNAEAFTVLTESALARPPTGMSGGERYQVLVHVDAETLATDQPGASATGRGECSIADGPGISPETARRLSCDSSVVPILEGEGKALSAGRRTRSVPPSIRRALAARDGRCQFPGCERGRFVDAHHIRHWARGGETSIDNLVLLCRHHHRLVHEGGFSVRLDAEGRRRFTDPDGAEVLASPSPLSPSLPSPSTSHSPTPPARDLRNGNRARGLELGAETTLTGSGEKMDLGLCVDAVLVATGRD